MTREQDDWTGNQWRETFSIRSPRNTGNPVKEAEMDININDIIIHVHPELPADTRDEVVTELRDDNGVLSACFSTDNVHALTVAYNTELINSSDVLQHVRHWDQKAMMVGM